MHAQLPCVQSPGVSQSSTQSTSAANRPRQSILDWNPSSWKESLEEEQVNVQKAWNIHTLIQ